MTTELELYSMFMGEIFNKYFVTNKQTMYHYTSPDALQKIIKDKQLWFSDIHYMNDKSEIEYTKNLLMKIITYKKGLNKDFLFTLRDCLNMNCVKEVNFCIPRTIKKQYYIASFSLSPDELSLWNYYTKNDKKGGYNIGFNIKKFLNRVELLMFGRLIAGKIIYKESQQQQIIDLLLNKYDEKYNISQGTDAKNILIEEFQTYINILSLFFKNEVFATEKEYRIVFIDYDNNHPKKEENYKREYRILNGIFIPYVTQDFLPNDIESITASPLIDYSLLFGLEKFLQDNGVNIKVSKSKIPLRY